MAESSCQEGIAFNPLAAESLGGWHEVAEREVKKLSAALARQQGTEEKEASTHLFQKLSILLHRGNASLFLNRTPDYVQFISLFSFDHAFVSLYLREVTSSRFRRVP